LRLAPSAFRLLPVFVCSETFDIFMVEYILSNLNRCIMGHFEELKVWQKAVDLAVKVIKSPKRNLSVKIMV